MAVVRVNARGQVTIPARLRAAANLHEGDSVELEVTPEGVLIKPGPQRDPDQWWFWQPKWLEGKLEIDRKLKENPGPREAITGEELLAWMEESIAGSKAEEEHA